MASERNLSTLIEQAEKLTVPDRAFDARMWCAASVTDQIFDDYGIADGWHLEHEPNDNGSVTQWAVKGKEAHKRARRAAPPYSGSLDAIVALVKQQLPGWIYSICECHLSDDAYLMPDYNHPVHGARFLAEFPEIENDPAYYWQCLTDVDRRPAGNLPIALCTSLLLALQEIQRLRAARKKGQTND